MSTPAPFEITKTPDGMTVASDGARRVILLDADGRVFRRRAVKGLGAQAVGDAILPRLNELAGDLLARMDMPASELAARLQALALQCTAQEPQQVEWAVTELAGVRVYVSANDVVVTRRDIVP